MTVANSRGIYMSSDYQLVDLRTREYVSDSAGTKQLEASFAGLHIQLAFTGIAEIYRSSVRVRTIDWLSAELQRVSPDCTVQDVCDAIAKRSESELKLCSRKELTIVLGVASVGKLFQVAVISNTDWSERPPRTKDKFDIDIHTITKPFHCCFGMSSSVPKREVARLAALARSTDKSPKEMLDELSAIHAIASKNSRGCISEGCWASAQIADQRARRITTVNSGGTLGSVPQLMSGIDILDFVKKNFRAAPGQEIKIEHIGGVIAGPEGTGAVLFPEGDPRKFNFSGSSVTKLLRCSCGLSFISIEIAQLECSVLLRRNESVTVPFANIRVHTAHPICKGCKQPKYPWPIVGTILSIDSVPVPRGWEYSVGCWTDRGSRIVQVPQSSRGVRNLAFLGDDDEFVIAAPSPGIEFMGDPPHEGLSISVRANISWRTRPDGTRG